ncbi:hypothetical protein FH972_003126 [Carpinus fangiana]|uniref:Uncharacterized protein n=1 Tax=Carpinus fangiana TaxID=176857 RepID=A0A5N6QHJ2_9ROSI|nr:hypothetical protein FH972_003126 [Carpinus fangiana]
MTVASAIWDGAGWRVGVCSLSKSLALWVIDRIGLRWWTARLAGHDLWRRRWLERARARRFWAARWFCGCRRGGQALCRGCVVV